MKKSLSLTVFPCALLGALSSAPSIALDWSLEAGIEGRRFIEEAAYPKQVDDQWSLSLQPEMVWDSEGGNGRFTLTPFYRYDHADSERTHADIREAMYMTWDGQWEVRAGIGRVFWGVTESLHLVDVINQTDLVESSDGEEKLGQPMVQAMWYGDSGTWEAFVLPGFRERTFPGEEGRMRFPYVVEEEALYQANAEERHTDLALRWSNTFELSGYSLDLSTSVFRGTSREPLYVPNLAIVGTEPVVTGLTAFYPMQNQIGATVQFAPEGWLLKAELLHRDIQIEELGGTEIKDQTAAVTGFEYTVVGPMDTAIDLGLLLEYQYDSRGTDALAQNDVFLGTRFAFNDMASSEILAGITQDLDDTASYFFLLEGTTRLNPSTTMDVTLFAVEAGTDDPLSAFRRDDSVEVGLNFYF